MGIWFYTDYPIVLPIVQYPIRIHHIHIVSDSKLLTVVIEYFIILDGTASQTVFHLSPCGMCQLVGCGYVTVIRLLFRLSVDGYSFIQHSSPHYGKK